MLEGVRFELTPHEEEAIAGTGSRLDGMWRDESKHQPAYRSKIAAALLKALNAPKYVTARVASRTLGKSMRYWAAINRLLILLSARYKELEPELMEDGDSNAEANASDKN